MIQFRHSRGGVIELGDDALATMRSHAQLTGDATEAGGVLLGRHLRDGHDLIVDAVTVPQDGDVRHRFAFERNHQHQALIVEAWEKSGGTRVFLGDWHTHAEPRPTPSMTDLDNWNRMLREDVRDNEACFFVIVGQEEVRCWEGNRLSGKLITRLVRLKDNGRTTT